MKKIYLDQNYIIVEQDGLISALPIIRTLYSHVENLELRKPAYLIYDSNIYSIEILISEVIAGNWLNAEKKAWTDEELLRFLRGNTGSNTVCQFQNQAIIGDGDGGTVITNPPFGDGDGGTVIEPPIGDGTAKR
tara:strand:- start:843 stop:1244 length:402 start_codon:yes stop_codon:yes gene_type:complete